MTPPAPAPSSRARTTILAIIFAGAILTGARMMHRSLATSDMTPVHGDQLFDDVRTHLSKLYVDTISDSGMYHMAVDGLMRELNDPDNAFLPADGHKPALKPSSTHALAAVQRATVLPDAIGYVALPTFNDATTPRELTKTIDSLVHTGAHSLIIDVRADTTDSLGAGVQLAGLFLNPGQEIVHTRGRIPGATYAYAGQHPQHWPTLPLVVLVNHKTANAAELFAGALQDHDRAVIIGSPTAGHGTTQTLYPVDGVGTLKLTTTRWFTPSGRSISKLPSQQDQDDAAPLDSTSKKPTYKTDTGRRITGGGGIIPDVLVHISPAPVHQQPNTSPSQHPATPTTVVPDTTLITAQQLLAGIHTQSEALARAAKIASAQQPSP